LLLLGVAFWMGSAALASAAGRVELELVTEERVPITSQQEWMRRLGEAGVTNVRIRSAGLTGAVRVGVEVRGGEAAPTYAVTGVITSGDVLVLPGGRFQTTQAAQVARWLDELARLGPAEKRPARSAFGLDAVQFQAIHDELARPASVSTKGVTRSKAVESILRGLTVPVRCDRAMLDAAAADELAEELSGLSCGTALAYALRAPGLCLVPRATASGVELEIVAARPEMEVWPVGWKSEKPDRDVLPALYEFLNVKLDGVAATKVLEALGERLKVPVLPDHNAMARHGVDPDTAYINFPDGRTSYSLLLQRALFQARLKSELRVDEAGNPLLWITTLKPL
jgi:hypothetical protein